MAPTSKRTLWGLIAATPRDVDSDTLGSAIGPLVEARNDLFKRFTLARRDDEYEENGQPNPSSGVLDPHDISNVGFFVLFALIGVAFVVTGIWFFFWARNGGFHFKEGDWDDYKTTVLRRKGPNGTLLSGATPSTDLGGGSVYKDIREHDDDGRTVVTESTGLSGITAGPSDIGAREKRERKREMRKREKEMKKKEKYNEKSSGQRHMGNDGVEDEMAEREAKQELRSYRHERPARVGGLNKESEGSQWDGSTNPTDSNVSSNSKSHLLSNRQSTPTKETRSPAGIRKVYSTADKNEAERLRMDARRRREEANSGAGSPSRTARRDFSYQRSVVGSESALTESLLETGSDLGTKSYHHPRPELRTQAQREQRQREREDRRARRGGYRRGRGEDDDEL